MAPFVHFEEFARPQVSRKRATPRRPEGLLTFCFLTRVGVDTLASVASLPDVAGLRAGRGVVTRRPRDIGAEGAGEGIDVYRASVGVIRGGRRREGRGRFKGDREICRGHFRNDREISRGHFRTACIYRPNGGGARPGRQRGSAGARVIARCPRHISRSHRKRP